MNNVKFLVCNINNAFPADINELIFKKVQQNSAESIQRMYYLRVKINLDAFIIFNRMFPGSGYYNVAPGELHNINKLIAFYGTRIRYSFIQEPGIWIDTLTDVINRCGHFQNFHINNAYFIINSVKTSNYIFRRTFVPYWENL